MSNEQSDDKKSAIEIARLLDDAADAIRERAYEGLDAGRLSQDEYMDARAEEMVLRTKLQLAVVKKLSDVLKEVAKSGDNLADAIVDATKRIKKIEDLRKGLEIVASLIVLAGALASQDPKAIVKAGKGVVKAGKT